MLLSAELILIEWMIFSTFWEDEKHHYFYVDSQSSAFLSTFVSDFKLQPVFWADNRGDKGYVTLLLFQILQKCPYLKICYLSLSLSVITKQKIGFN